MEYNLLDIFIIAGTLLFMLLYLAFVAYLSGNEDEMKTIRVFSQMMEKINGLIYHLQLLSSLELPKKLLEIAPSLSDKVYRHIDTEGKFKIEEYDYSNIEKFVYIFKNHVSFDVKQFLGLTRDEYKLLLGLIETIKDEEYFPKYHYKKLLKDIEEDIKKFKFQENSIKSLLAYRKELVRQNGK